MDSSIPFGRGYSKVSTSVINDVVGVALSGVVFLNGLYNNKDVYAPASNSIANGNPISKDTCWGAVHSGGNGAYHYNTISPCLFGTTIKTTQKTWCSEDPACKFDNLLQNIDLSKAPEPIGVAKDGHIIYGPYKDASGNLYKDCDVDMCSGIRLGTGYAYIASTKFSYIAGCWGPSNSPSFYPTCSANRRQCDSGMVLKIMGTMVGAILSLFMLY